MTQRNRSVMRTRLASIANKGKRRFAFVPLLVASLGFAAAGCASDDLVKTKECLRGQIDCGGTCVDISSNPDHCGACEYACGSALSCSRGMCQLDCHSGLEKCGRSCVDIFGNNNNCGSCGRECEKGKMCGNLECVANCPDGQTECDIGCVDTHSDPAHCGGCGNTCEGETVCVGGTCVDKSLCGLEICGGACVDTDYNPRYCGDCDTRCSAGQLCDHECVNRCSEPQTYCEGVCADTRTDRDHCGEKCEKCSEWQRCDSGCVDGLLCERAAARCDEHKVCDPMLQCVDGCAINGVFYAKDAVNPGNDCQRCKPLVSSTEWTDSAENDSCGTDGRGHRESAGISCVEYCKIGGDSHADGTRNPVNQCQQCDVRRSATGWTNLEANAACGTAGVCYRDSDGISCVDSCEGDGTTCGPGKVCREPACVPGCNISGTFYNINVAKPEAQCRACRASDTTDWTITAGEPCTGTGTMCDRKGDCIDPRSIAVGWIHTCGINAVGGVYCWGKNDEGQVGDGDGSAGGQVVTPRQVVGLTSGVVSLSAGSYHTCAVTALGELYCWGRNSSGQLGVGNNATPVRTPTQVEFTSLSPAPGSIVAVSAGENHTCAVDSVGAAMCWGHQKFGAIGDGVGDGNIIDTIQNRPKYVIGLESGVSAISAGFYHTCAIQGSSGIPYCWGNGLYGRIGDGVRDHNPRTTPTPLKGNPTGYFAIAAGDDHTCAITSESGDVKCWGNNGYGQLGYGEPFETMWGQNEPAAVSGFSGCTKISAGRTITCCIKVEGSSRKLLCTGGSAPDGDNRVGLGSDTFYVKAPTQLESDSVVLSGVFSVSNWGPHSCALVPAGARCWGWGVHGQIGDGYKVDRGTPVSVVGFP